MKKIIHKISGKLKDLQDAREKYDKKKETEKLAEYETLLEDGKTLNIDISTKTIVKVILVIAIFLALQQIFFQLQSVLIIAAICFFLAMGLAPVVSFFESKKIPRPLAILLLYIAFFGGLGVLFVKIVPILAEQLLAIARDLQEFIINNDSSYTTLQNIFGKVGAEFDPAALQEWLSQNLSLISNNLQAAAGSAFGIMSDIFKGVFNLIFALVLLFFILMEREQIAYFALALFPPRKRSYIQTKSENIQLKMAEWFKAQVILMIVMGAFMFAGMKFLEWTLGMKYAATLGLLAGFMELFPYIGVLATGILAGLIALNISWVLLFAVIVWIAIAQFLEGNFLVPYVMERVVGLSSVATLLALAIGGILGNAIGGVPLSILGMILSVPIAASISIFVDEYVKREELE